MTPEERFVELAQPHSWLLVADNLHDQATRLHGSKGQQFLLLKDEHGRVSDHWDSADRIVFLLCGFALENALKAFLVYENPSWISNGRLSKELRSHSLTKLSNKSVHAPYKVRGTWALERFESGLQSWARYPTALNIEECDSVQGLDERLWDWYLRIARAYGNRLQDLLRRPWNGPHGYEARFKFRGQFLSQEASKTSPRFLP